MSIRVSKRVVVTVVLVLVGIVAFLCHRSIRVHRILTAGKWVGQGAERRDGETSTDPRQLLAEASRLYWLNNGPKAAPLFARAEKLFADEGNHRDELYAKVGRLRSEAETMSFVELSRILRRTTPESDRPKRPKTALVVSGCERLHRH